MDRATLAVLDMLHAMPLPLVVAARRERLTSVIETPIVYELFE